MDSGRATGFGGATVWPYELRRGHSNNPAEGACAMDAVNWLAHGRHGDTPECACSVIGAYVTLGNDAMGDLTRQRLLPFLHRIAGSRSAAHESVRSRVLMLAAVRVFAPLALHALGLTETAAGLRGLPDDVFPFVAAREADLAYWTAKKPIVTVSLLAVLEARNAALKVGSRLNRVAAGAAARAARWAAEATTGTAGWDAYFEALDAALRAGPQGEAWSADVAAAGLARFERAAGLVPA